LKDWLLVLQGLSVGKASGQSASLFYHTCTVDRSIDLPVLYDFKFIISSSAPSLHIIQLFLFLFEQTGLLFFVYFFKVRSAPMKRKILAWRQELGILEELNEGDISLKACSRKHKLSPKSL
jgi:hypothetical protein